MITVLLVDDHQVIRSGLQTLLDVQPDIEVSASVGSGEEAVASYTAEPSTVVFMDLSMPGIGGIEATRRIITADPSARVVVLTSYGDRQQVTLALDAGACGYLLKDASPDTLVTAVRTAADGGSPMDPRITAVILDERKERRGQTGPRLSAREMDVLRLVTEGLLNKEIARRLDISEKTVKAHLTRIFDRLGVSDRTQAALWAERAGIFKPTAERHGTSEP